MKIAIGIFGTIRNKNCLDDLKKFILDQNQDHEIHIYAYLWDIKGDRVKMETTDYNIMTDSPVLFMDGVYRCDTTLADCNSFISKIKELGYKCTYKIFNYKEYIKNEHIPQFHKWSKLHRKTYYMYHKPKFFLMEKLINDIEDDYDYLFFTRGDVLVTDHGTNLPFKNLKFIDKKSYTYNGKPNMNTSDKNFSFNYFKDVFGVRSTSSDYRITTFLRHTGTCGFEWMFGDYKSMKKLCSIYSCYDYVIYLITKTQHILGDEIIKTIHCIMNDIYIDGLIDGDLYGSAEDIKQRYLTQEYNVSNCSMYSNIPDELL